MNTAEFWPEAVGYGQAAAGGGYDTGLYERNSYTGNGYDRTGYGGNAYDGAGSEPGWAAPPDGPSSQEWQNFQNWQDWGPPPALHPDHPSAPVPRIQLTDDHPSGPMPVAPEVRPPELPKRRPGKSERNWNPPQQAPDNADGNRRRLYAIPDDGLAVHHVATALHAPENPERRFSGQRPVRPAGPAGPAGPVWQEATDYRREASPSGPVPGRPTGRFQDIRSPSRDLLWTAEQVLTLADGQAAQVAREAEDYAAAIREAAEREAAAITRQATSRADAITHEATAIREAAEREAAELRARLDSMSGELGRVATYVTENLAGAPMPTTAPVRPGTTHTPREITHAPPDMAPALPDVMPALPGKESALPGTRPGGRTAMPTTRPTRPDTGPGTRPAGPARPRTTPTKSPTKKPQTIGRQQRAARIATVGTAALVSVAAVGAVTMTGIHGFSFFTFRESAQGETPGNFTDADFVAGKKECLVSGIPAVCPAARHHDSAPKGRHHKATGSK